MSTTRQLDILQANLELMKRRLQTWPEAEHAGLMEEAIKIQNEMDTLRRGSTDVCSGSSQLA